MTVAQSKAGASSPHGSTLPILVAGGGIGGLACALVGSLWAVGRLPVAAQVAAPAATASSATSFKAEPPRFT